MKKFLKIFCLVLAVAFVFGAVSQLNIDFPKANINSGSSGGRPGSTPDTPTPPDDPDTDPEIVSLLSDTHVFNSKIALTGTAAANIEQNVEFTYLFNGESGSGSSITVDNENNQLLLGSNVVYQNGNWTSIGVPTVDFGSEKKVVTKEFYEWFIANAQKVDLSYKLSGKYVAFLGENFVQTVPSSAVELFVDFRAYVGGEWKDYDYVRYDGSGQIYFINHSESYNDLVWADGDWCSSKTVILDFGSAEKNVTETFYDYVTGYGFYSYSDTVKSLTGTYFFEGEPGDLLDHGYYAVDFAVWRDDEWVSYDHMFYDSTNGELDFVNEARNDRMNVFSAGMWYMTDFVLKFEDQEVQPAVYDWVMAESETCESPEQPTVAIYGVRPISDTAEAPAASFDFTANFGANIDGVYRNYTGAYYDSSIGELHFVNSGTGADDLIWCTGEMSVSNLVLRFGLDYGSVLVPQPFYDWIIDNDGTYSNPAKTLSGVYSIVGEDPSSLNYGVSYDLNFRVCLDGSWLDCSSIRLDAENGDFYLGGTCVWSCGQWYYSDIKIDFGTEAMAVPNLVYDWVTENFEAVKTLSGVYRMKDEANVSLDYGVNTVHYSFWTGDRWMAHEGFFYDNENGYLYLGTTEDGVEVWETGQWRENSCIFDFGSEPQEVSATIYDWIMNNAEPYTMTYTLSGTWTFNPSIAA